VLKNVNNERIIISLEAMLRAFGRTTAFQKAL
jgi:hypothetical protein